MSVRERERVQNKRHAFMYNGDRQTTNNKTRAQNTDIRADQ